jgi:hypothetical protein
VNVSCYKVDSGTVKVTAKLRYRARGRRIIGKKSLDTTFLVNYVKPSYDALTDNLSWINCDKFYDYKDKVNFYVSTPAIKGLRVMAYFKQLHAFMPAMVSAGKYKISNVPADMKVILVGIGKKGEDFYFTKSEVIIGKGTFSLHDVVKVSSNEFRKLMAAL